MSYKTNSSRFLFFLASIVISLAGIKFAAPILVPFLLAFFVTIICNPVINFLEHYKMPRSFAIALVIIFIFFGFVLLGGVITSAVTDFRRALPQYELELSNDLNLQVAWLMEHNFPISLSEVRKYVNPSKIMVLVTSTLSGFSSILSNTFLLLLTVIFMLGEGAIFTKKIQLVFGNESDVEDRVNHFFYSVNKYMAIKTIVSLVTAFIIGFVLWLINLDFFVLWALLVFLLNYIPNIGSIIAAVPAIALAFLQLGYMPALFVALLFIIVNILMGNVVEPKLMGRNLGLSTLAVFLSLIFWGWLLGIIGMLLSVPLTMILKIGLEKSKAGQNFALFISSEDEINALAKINDNN
ncbi:MAG: AI-2E family transporter [Psychromonas sp.]|nr:AI-2E family transporter [Psychromonas sp.]